MASLTLTEKINAISDLIRLKRQYGTFLLALPALWSLFMATGGRPPLKLLVVFILGSFLMRSAGCAMNDIADRKLDPLVERTRLRPVASGRLGVPESLAVFLVLSAFAFTLVLTLNSFTVKLSFVAILLAVIYPFVKRISFFPQVFLGIAFGFGAIMAWSAVHSTVAIAAIFIFLANVFFSTAYDTIYALMDIEDDKKAGVKSTAIFFGKHVHTALIALYAGVIICLSIAGYFTGLGAIYYTALAAAFAAFLYFVFDIKANSQTKSFFSAFVSNSYIGAFILIGIIIDINIGKVL